MFHAKIELLANGFEPCTGAAARSVAMCELTHHSHEVCLATDPDGRTQVCAEWQLAFDDAQADAFRLRTGPPVRVCFCADAATLRELALAMAACADELDAIQARTARCGAIPANWRNFPESLVLHDGERG